MAILIPDLEELVIDYVHTLTDEEFEVLIARAKEIKDRAEKGEELTLEDQKIILDWRRADRETKFILNKKPVKPVKEPKVPKEKVVKIKKPKKLSKLALGQLCLKEIQGEVLTEDENRNKHFTLTGEIL